MSQRRSCLRQSWLPRSSLALPRQASQERSPSTAAWLLPVPLPRTAAGAEPLPTAACRLSEHRTSSSERKVRNSQRRREAGCRYSDQKGCGEVPRSAARFGWSVTFPVTALPRPEVELPPARAHGRYPRRARRLPVRPSGSRFGPGFVFASTYCSIAERNQKRPLASSAIGAGKSGLFA